MNIFSIAVPKNGQETTVVSAGQPLAFPFDVTTLSFSRSKNSLVIESAEGGKAVLEDFFVVGTENKLPSIELADGTTISAEEFLQAMNPNMDLSTVKSPSLTLSGLCIYRCPSGPQGCFL